MRTITVQISELEYRYLRRLLALKLVALAGSPPYTLASLITWLEVTRRAFKLD